MSFFHEKRAHCIKKNNFPPSADFANKSEELFRELLHLKLTEQRLYVQSWIHG